LNTWAFEKLNDTAKSLPRLSFMVIPVPHCAGFAWPAFFSVVHPTQGVRPPIKAHVSVLGAIGLMVAWQQRRLCAPDHPRSAKKSPALSSAIAVQRDLHASVECLRDLWI